MEYSHYDGVPAVQQAKIIAAAKTERTGVAASELRRHPNSSVKRRIRKKARRPVRSRAFLMRTSRATSGGLGDTTRVMLRTSTTVAYARQPLTPGVRGRTFPPPARWIEIAGAGEVAASKT
jgi:hypothetical protein